MAITIAWGSRIISIPRNDLALIQATPTEIRQLDLNVFRLTLKDLEDDEAGMAYPTTHIHNPEVIISGVTFSRQVILINGYTVTFEDGQYAVNLVGANSNVADFTNVNSVSIRPQNSAGLVTTSTASSALTTEQAAQLQALATLLPKVKLDTSLIPALL